MSWSFLCSGNSVKMIDDCLFCRCRGLSCVQELRLIVRFVDVVVFLVFRELG